MVHIKQRSWPLTVDYLTTNKRLGFEGMENAGGDKNDFCGWILLWRRRDDLVLSSGGAAARV